MRLRDEPVDPAKEEASDVSVHGVRIRPGSTQMIAPTQKLSQVGYIPLLKNFL